MKDFRLLKFLDKFQNFFEKIGVQYEIMRKILWVKLTMDSRRESTFMMNQNNKNKDQEGNGFYKSLWIYGIMGLFLIMFVVMDNYYIVQMGLVFGMTMFMAMASLISDFSTVLLDLRDKGIVLTKPVNERTLSMAKIIHILNYIIIINFSLVGPSLIVSLFVKGIVFFLIYFVGIILMNLFIVSITALVYLFILRFFDGEKLKDIINYIQIILSIVMIVGYQFIGRIYQFIDFDNRGGTVWFEYIIPPFWFAAPFEVFLNKTYSTGMLVLTTLAVIVPIIAIITYIKLMPSFERNLQKLSTVTEGVKNKKTITERVGELICRDRIEKNFFDFANNLMSSERDFKLKLYPSLGFAIVFPFIMIFSIYSTNFEGIQYSKSYLTIYLSIAYILMGINILNCSSNFKGAWIYKAIPIENLGMVRKGVLKAFIVKYVMPLFLVQSVIYMCIYGLRIIPDLIGVLCASFVIIILIYKWYVREIPFSASFNDLPKESVATMIKVSFLLGLVWIIHYGLTFIPVGSVIFILFMIGINFFTWRKAF